MAEVSVAVELMPDAASAAGERRSGEVAKA
jgi:hypothetical protein